MDALDYKPVIYEGKDPFIYISCHQDDKKRIMGILERLDFRGFRFWIDDGITPGMESDEIIAEHIENCDFFIACLSGKYLGFLDKVDELNYSRDVNKDYLLLYLENVSLPAGLDMRFMRARDIRAYGLSDEEVYSQLLAIDRADRFYGIADIKLRQTAERVFARLEDLYPEHKVFALDAVAHQLSKSGSELYVKAGYPSIERLLLDYGFAAISTENARTLRSSVLYQPGFEPDAVRPRIDYILDTLRADYPDGEITDVLEKKHKSIYKSVLGLSVWLGYNSAADMLNAYGFTGVRLSNRAGRMEVDHVKVLNTLQSRYENAPKPSSVAKIYADNPDLKGSLKTLSNRSGELFGMSLARYLRQTGLIVPAEKEEIPTVTAKNRELIIADIRAMYEHQDTGYGSFEETEDTLDQVVLKRSAAGSIYIYDCRSCSEMMKIPYGVHFIGKEAFAGQSDMTTLILPPTVKEIREKAFMDCDGLETLVLPEGLERIGNNAFSGCTSLKEVVFPSTLLSVGNEAFSGCSELENVAFGSLRTNVQEDAFDGCIYELENLQDENASPAEFFELKVDKRNSARIISYTGDEEIVVVPGMIGGHPITSIEKGCFKGNETVQEIYISNAISAVNGDVFRDCPNLKKVHISEAVSSLTGTAFAGCSSLMEVNIPDKMTEVQRGLFKDSPLTTLYVGKGVKRISPDAFYKGDMDIATGMYFKNRVLENLMIDSGNESFSASGSLLLSKDGKTLYAELGDPLKAVIPEGVEEIGAGAYDKLSSLREVSFPSTLKKISEKAFAGTCITSVELPAALEVIESQAFSYCRSLRKVEINEGLKVIGDQAFEGCPVESVYIPASVETLGKDSFLAISTYQGETPQSFRIDTANPFVFGDGIALYQRSEDKLTLVKAYYPGLRSKQSEEESESIDYEIKAGTTEIAEHAFSRCNNLASVVIPEGVLSIGDLAFWDCSKLKEVHIPESCTELSLKAFFGTTVNFI